MGGSEIGRKKGFLIVISASSGVGKTTLVRMLLERVDRLRYSISATTRPRLAGERDGIDYFFVSETKFEEMAKGGELLEWAEVYGHKYGTPRGFIQECVDSGEDVILDIDIQGARQVRENWPGAVLVFLLPPSMEELERRLRRRGRDAEASIRQRLDSVSQELEAIRDYDYVIVNDRLGDSVSKLEAVIIAERLKVARCEVDEFIHRFRGV